MGSWTSSRGARLVPLIIAVSCVSQAFGQYSYPPYVYSVGNSASYYDSSMPGYGIAPGSMMVLFGSQLGPDQLLQNSGFPLPLDLGGTSIKVTVNGAVRNAPIVYTSAGQVAAMLPSSTPVGQGTVVLTYKGQDSYPTRIDVVESAFGIYSILSSGMGAGLITSDYQVKTLADGFRPNDTLVLWGTGLGAISGDDGTAPPPVKNFAGVEVYVGSQSARVIYAGRSGCCAGLDQVNFVVPEGVLGCFVPVTVRSGGVTSNFVYMPVASGGGPCSEPVGIPADLLRTAQTGQVVNLAAVAMGPVSVLQTVGLSYSRALAQRLSATLRMRVTEKQVSDLLRANTAERQKTITALVKKSSRRTADRIARLRAVARLARDLDQQGSAAVFGQLSGLDHVVAQLGQIFPPPGTCSVYSGAIDSRWNWASERKGFDAGPELVLSGPPGTLSLSRVSKGQYQTSFGGGFAGPLPAGAYTVSAIGGADVGPFTASVMITGDLRWTNKPAAFVDRTKPLEVTWSGGSAEGYVLFGGSAGAGSGDIPRMFACVEDVRKGRFTVPTFVLGALPAGRFGYLFLGTHPFQNRFSAKGLDAAYIADLNTDYQQVEIR